MTSNYEAGTSDQKQNVERIEDAPKQAHEDYSWLGSIVYIAQLVMQPLIAYVLVKLPTGKFAGAMVFCWGAVLSCMAVAHNFKGLFAARFFLGCFEASVGMYDRSTRLAELISA